MVHFTRLSGRRLASRVIPLGGGFHGHARKRRRCPRRFGGAYSHQADTEADALPTWRPEVGVPLPSLFERPTPPLRPRAWRRDPLSSLPPSHLPICSGMGQLGAPRTPRRTPRQPDHRVRRGRRRQWSPRAGGAAARDQMCRRGSSPKPLKPLPVTTGLRRYIPLLMGKSEACWQRLAIGWRSK